MPHAAAEEPLEHLLAAARAQGRSVSRAQLHRWQQEGVLARPRQQGLGRGRGTAVLYPAGTARQLVALCDQLERDRSFQVARWRLWWDGYSIEGSWIREQLREVLGEAETLRSALEAFDKGERGKTPEQRKLVRLLDHSDRQRLPAGVMARVRRRTGRARFPTFLYLSVLTAIGRFRAWRDTDDAQIVAKGLGIDAWPPPDDQTPESELEALCRQTSRLLNPDALREALDAATPEDLVAARDELRVLFSCVDAFLKLAEGVVGRGVRTIMQWFDADPGSEDIQHFAFLVWLSARRSPPFRLLYDWFVTTAPALRAGQSIRVVGDELHIDGQAVRSPGQD